MACGTDARDALTFFASPPARRGQAATLARARPEPITDADVQRLAEEAERGYDVDALVARRGKRGRPALGSAPASVESVRLDPELREQLTARAQADGTTASEVIRQALRDYLHAA